MKSKFLLATALLIVVAAVFIFGRPRPTAKTLEPEPMLSPEGVPVPFPSPSVSPKVAPSKSADLPLVETMPSVESMRSEVEANPHRTPPSLLAFAAQLAPRFDEALKSPVAAEKFFGELKDCVQALPSTNTRSVRALCLMNVRRIGEKLPAFHARVNEFLEKADPEIVRLSK